MANQHTARRPAELAELTTSRAYGLVETSEQLLDAVRAVEQAIFELERYASVVRATQAQADRAIQALDELPQRIDALEKVMKAKLPVLRRRVERLQVD